MYLKNRPAVSKNVEITITPIEETFVAYIEGPDQLRLDRQDKYKLVSNIPLDDEVTFSIQSWPNMDKKKAADYATLRQDIDGNNEPIPNQYILHANARNNLGNVVLVATYKQVEYTKTIEIIPLW